MNPGPVTAPQSDISVHQVFTLELPADKKAAPGVAKWLYDAIERFAPENSPAMREKASDALRDTVGFARIWSQLEYRELPDQNGVELISQCFRYGETVVVQLVWHWIHKQAIGELAHKLPSVLLSPPALECKVPEHRLAVSVQAESSSRMTTAQCLMKQMVTRPLLSDGLQEVRMDSASFFFSRELADEQPWPAALLFDTEAGESNEEVGRYLLQEWPMTVMYASRISQHSESLAKESATLRKLSSRILQVLDKYLPGSYSLPNNEEDARIGGLTATPVLVQVDEPIILHTRSPEQLQEALNQIHEPKARLIRAISNVERQRIILQNDLESTERHARILSSVRSTATHFKHPMGGGDHLALLEILSTTWAGRLRQIDANLTWAHHALDQASDAGSLLLTQADILEAQFERKLAMGVGVVGVLLALGQIIDVQVTSIAYCTWLGAIWEALELPQPTAVAFGRPLLWFRLSLIFVLWLVFSALVIQWVRGRRRGWFVALLTGALLVTSIVVFNAYFGLFAWPVKACPMLTS